MKYVVKEGGRIRASSIPLDGAFEVEDNVSVDQIMVTEEGVYPLSDAPSIHHRFDHASNTWIVNDAEVRAFLLGSIDRYREKKNAEPITYEGAMYDADEKAQRNFSAWMMQVNNGASLPEGFVWRDYYNIDRVANADFLRGISAAITLRGTLLYQIAWQHKAAVNAIKTTEELAAYDITTGWD